MQVRMKAGAWLDPARMLKTITDAGFTPIGEEVFLTLTGTVALRDGRLVLVLDQMKETKEVALASGPSDEALRRSLESESGSTVRIHGRWLVPDATLLVDEVRPVGDAGKEDGGRTGASAGAR